ncbi:hypothetical protein ACQKIE_18560 [Luteibacter sp. NPDC031894]|uniref:hypothetical protein n=1 Tax=Luteibacter sp. NPDC031894 TaxID=3390572 RepID=UPI003CFE3E12
MTQGKWKSHAQWPLAVYRGMDGSGVSTDTHLTEEEATAVCRLLERDGFGGERKAFPIRTWVSSAQPNPAAVYKNKAHQRAYLNGQAAKIAGKGRLSPYAPTSRTSAYFRRAWLDGYDNAEASL